MVDFDSGRASEGYIFISPFFMANTHPDSGAHIFDHQGHLIWSGIDATGGAGQTDVQGLHICQYRGENYLCAWAGHRRGMHGSGLGLIINQHYEVVKTVQSCSATASADMHEFILTADNTAIITVYQPQYHQGRWILNSLFQEVALDDGRCVFEWSALDHIDLNESYVPIDSYALVGSGTNQARAWDYCHINSVEKLCNGDFLVSLRHTDTILRISGNDGRILWRLNGKKTDFEMVGTSFRRQHMARVMEEEANHTIISLFNNDSDGFTAKGQVATGVVVRVDHSNNTATEVTQFRVPAYLTKQSKGMGSHQQLRNGNHFVGYGTDSAMTEHHPNGSLLWAAHLPWRSWNYRAFKDAWIGLPKSPPALWTYARSNSSPIAFHASWNGATNVSHWKFYGASSRYGPFAQAGSTVKTGFETSLLGDRFYPFAFAEACSEEGSLGRSVITATYVVQPGVDDDEICGPMHCFSTGDSTGDDQHKTETTDRARHDPRRWVGASLTWMEHLMAGLGVLACAMLCRQKGVLWGARKFRYQKLPSDSEAP